jgi:hypothetical protein
MIIDGNLQFSGTAGVAGSPDSPTTGTQVSGNVIDLLNARDMGIGDDPALKVLAEVITTFTGGTSLQVNFQTSPDNITFTTAVSGPVVAEAQLLAGTYLLAIDVPRYAPGLALPRYLRLQYISVGTHGAGSLFASIVLDRQDQIVSAANQQSGYPPGVVVAN